MTKNDQIMLFTSIEQVREELERAIRSNAPMLDQLAISERLVSLYACINTDDAIDALAMTNKKLAN